MRGFQLDIPPHVADIIRLLPSDLKRGVKSALRLLSTDPSCGVPLLRELEGCRKYRVRRFRIVYGIDQRRRTLRILAVGHRRQVYEELVAQIQSH